MERDEHDQQAIDKAIVAANKAILLTKVRNVIVLTERCRKTTQGEFVEIAFGCALKKHRRPWITHVRIKVALVHRLSYDALLAQMVERVRAVDTTRNERDLQIELPVRRP